MAEIQWIKLKVDMFDNEKIKLIESMPDADSILVIWIKLLTYAGKANSNGYIMLTENIPMNEEEIATIFNRNINTIRYAFEVFSRYGMIEKNANAFRIKNWESHQNIEGMEKIREQNRLRKAQQRERERKSLPEKEGAKSHVTSRDGHATELELEEDIEKEKERDINTTHSSNAIERDFEKWWNQYDKKIDRKKAYQKFKLCYKKHGFEQIEKGTTAYLYVVDEKQYQKNPTTFLNGESYLDIDGYRELYKQKLVAEKQKEHVINNRYQNTAAETRPKWLDEEKEKKRVNVQELKTATDDKELSDLIAKFRES